MENLIPLYKAFYDDLLRLLPLFYRDFLLGFEEEKGDGLLEERNSPKHGQLPSSTGLILTHLN
jgi:hypothetical protein